MPKMLKFLIGNKNDFEKDRRKIQFQDGKNYAQQKYMEFYELSAKVNDGTIPDVFSSLANKIR